MPLTCAEKKRWAKFSGVSREIQLWSSKTSALKLVGDTRDLEVGGAKTRSCVS